MLCGIVGSLQAIEAIKLLLGLGDPLVGRLLAYDSLEQSFRTFKMRRDPNCPACGEHAGPIVIAEYDDLCMPHATASRPPGFDSGDVRGTGSGLAYVSGDTRK